MNLAGALHTAIDELRMQMLGVQVLFGFEFQALFQERFSTDSAARSLAHASGLILLVLAIGLLLTPPCQHRIVERGEASLRLYAVTKRHANLALLPIAAALGCAVYGALDLNMAPTASALFATLVTVAALFAWIALGRLLRTPHSGEREMQAQQPPLHEKIDQMLTEARVILPGAQALLGFQLVVMMTTAFAALPPAMRAAHVFALGCLCVCIILLIAPAALHRVAFSGADDPRLHRFGSGFITAALAPLALALSTDLAIAMRILSHSKDLGWLSAILALLLLVSVWYVIPYAIRRSIRGGPGARHRENSG